MPRVKVVLRRQVEISLAPRKTNRKKTLPETIPTYLPFKNLFLLVLPRAVEGITKKNICMYIYIKQSQITRCEFEI